MREPGHPGICLRCHQQEQITSRGLSRACHRLATLDGTLADYPRTKRPLAELLADYVPLHGEGYPERLIAERLGMRYRSLRRQIQRAHERGVLTIRNGVIRT